MPEQTLQLKDIKPIVAVPDHSLWLFLALVAAVLLLLGALVYREIKCRKKGGNPTRAEAQRRLLALDFNDTKTAVYDFSLLGHFVTTPETEPVFKALLSELEPYKFKKEVPPLDETLREKLHDFIEEAARG